MHADPLPENFVMSHPANGDSCLFLIDWEYSCLYDPFWDVAAVLEEAGFSGEQEDYFLSKYMGKYSKISREVAEEKVLIFKILQNAIWSLWAFYKTECGEDFYEYGNRRANAAVSQLKEYECKYCCKSSL